MHGIRITKMKKALLTSKLELNVRKKIVNCSILSIALYGAEKWIMLKVEQKFLESCEMWYWRRMDEIIWTDHVRNEEVLQKVQEERNVLKKTKRRKASWIARILHRKCLLKHLMDGKIEGKIEVTGRR
jgi:hypothetical protein